VFHSARWDHGQALGGRSVAVIGTGASAVQFVPRIQPAVGKLYVFQRTPPWIIPRGDQPILEPERQRLRTSRWALRWKRAKLYARHELLVLAFRFPRLAGLGQRIAQRHLEAQVADPLLRAKLTPSYRFGCKRVLVSDDYLPSLQQPNVELITEAIREVRPHSVVTAEGMEREVEVIILGTGFRVREVPFAQRVRGREGQTLAEHWSDKPTAHVGTTVAGYPNFFFLQGPNTGLGHSSVLLMLEAQIEHVLGALRAKRERGAATVEPRPESQAAFVAGVDARMRGTVWEKGGCRSWYLDEQGRNWTLWPGFTFTFMWRVRRFRPAEYRFSALTVRGGQERAVEPPRLRETRARTDGGLDEVV